MSGLNTCKPSYTYPSAKMKTAIEFVARAALDFINHRLDILQEKTLFHKTGMLHPKWYLLIILLILILVFILIHTLRCRYLESGSLISSYITIAHQE